MRLLGTCWVTRWGLFLRRGGQHRRHLAAIPFFTLWASLEVMAGIAPQRRRRFKVCCDDDHIESSTEAGKTMPMLIIYTCQLNNFETNPVLPANGRAWKASTRLDYSLLGTL